MPNPEIELEIRHIEPGDKFSGFSLGHESFVPLKTFLKQKALKFHNSNLARTYVAYDVSLSKRKFVGYITLVCGEVKVNDGDVNLVEEDYDYLQYPAIKIARLAVVDGTRLSGIGKTLVEISLGIAKSTVCPAVGCRFVMVDSKQSAVEFYKKCGFTLLNTQANLALENPVMFLDLCKTGAPFQAPPENPAVS